MSIIPEQPINALPADAISEYIEGATDVPPALPLHIYIDMWVLLVCVDVRAVCTIVHWAIGNHAKSWYHSGHWLCSFLT